ncbi:MAG: TlpA family protein disulfide reductase [Microscillaceae bacterium]|nr:TlpA family protein disulfide reductase [Microscillaceae bacterium]
MDIKRKTVWKEIREWGLLLAFLGLLFATGAHTYLQRAFLYTGWFNPKPTPETQMPPASYDLLLQDTAGNLFSLGEFKNKVVFLNFWATWCPPCVAEMPGIQAAYEQTHSEKVAFVMISLDENPARAEKYLQKKRLHLSPLFPGGADSGSL